ncbi:hypothetical protein GCM10009840_02700 [Pseudolysinimonas kribbensis]|uniref:DUF3494 domain-containing protein n=1 Tax=Pseudolysinimonas kribbensis TaxID=433641 RepID=A0ABQ6K4T2_9MICO|nr:ice-binding family protein [Pseudolysinimonas kribbensis]GMA94563.1 hypothetical protein GCM10025881_13870 [Pseudolysinimonas kribbensis]
MAAGNSTSILRIAALAVPLAAALALVTGVGSAMAAEAPVGMLTNEQVAVLAGSTVTNTGPTIVSGDLDLSPGSSVTGFGPGTVTAGTTHVADPVAVQAQADLTTATGDASSRASTGNVPVDLAGLTLVPGVYDGAALSLSGTLVLNGDADSVFILRAASTLITGSSSVVSMIGGATSCNVWWVVPSSATLGSDSTFVGTILAGATITADTDATIAGRLLASTGAVNLHSNLVTRPAGCTNTTGGSSSDGGGTDGTGGSGGTGGSATGGSSTTGGPSSSPTQTGTLAATGVSTVPAGLALGLLASGIVLTVLRRRILQARH